MIQRHMIHGFLVSGSKFTICPIIMGTPSCMCHSKFKRRKMAQLALDVKGFSHIHQWHISHDIVYVLPVCCVCMLYMSTPLHTIFMIIKREHSGTPVHNTYYSMFTSLHAQTLTDYVSHKRWQVLGLNKCKHLLKEVHKRSHRKSAFCDIYISVGIYSDLFQPKCGFLYVCRLYSLG